MYKFEDLPKVRGEYRLNAAIAKNTWFGVGGPAEILFKPRDEEDLIAFLQENQNKVPVTVIGVGSNLIIRDGGVEGVVVKLGREFTNLSLNADMIEVGAACLDVHVAQFALQHKRCGLEFFSGIPGTIGGAIAMNAGAYDGETFSVLHSYTSIDLTGKKTIINKPDFIYNYRENLKAEGVIFTKACFNAPKGNEAEIAEKMRMIEEKRESSQPIKSKTGGSTFKNPPGYSAWKLIDEAGCRGLQIGGAKMSEMHCNFMINTANATASNLEELINQVQAKVFLKTGIKLEPEIKIIGKNSCN